MAAAARQESVAAYLSVVSSYRTHPSAHTSDLWLYGCDTPVWTHKGPTNHALQGPGGRGVVAMASPYS